MDFIVRFKFTLLLITIFYGTVQSREAPINLVSIKDYAYIAHVRDLENPETFCAGVILTSKLFLTVARCVHGFISTPRTLTVHAGVGDTRHAWAYVENVMKIHVHPDYKVDDDLNMDANIAILVVNEGVEFGEYVKTADLPDEGSRFAHDILCTFIRWDPYKVDDVSYKRLHAFKMFTTGCRGTWQWDKVCAYKEYRNQGPCAWDLGSPLVMRGIVVGILNDAWDTCNEEGGKENSHVTYVAVAAHRKWIDSVMGDPDKGGTTTTTTTTKAPKPPGQEEIQWAPPAPPAPRPPPGKPGPGGKPGGKPKPPGQPPGKPRPPGTTGKPQPPGTTGRPRPPGTTSRPGKPPPSAGSHNVFAVSELTFVTVIVAIRFIFLRV